MCLLLLIILVAADAALVLAFIVDARAAGVGTAGHGGVASRHGCGGDVCSSWVAVCASLCVGWVVACVSCGAGWRVRCERWRRSSGSAERNGSGLRLVGAIGLREHRKRNNHSTHAASDNTHLAILYTPLFAGVFIVVPLRLMWNEEKTVAASQLPQWHDWSV